MSLRNSRYFIIEVCSYVILKQINQILNNKRKRSVMVMGNSLFSPASVFSTNIVGLVKIRSYCSFSQCGQTLTFLAFSIISSLIFSRVITAYAALEYRIFLYFVSSSEDNLILLQLLHVIKSSLWISSMKAICSTGSANSI